MKADQFLTKIYRYLIHFIYGTYAEIISRFTVDRDQRPLPSIPCQYCGGNHTEQLCPKAKDLGFMDDGR
jgi:hypothetical protein